MSCFEAGAPAFDAQTSLRALLAENARLRRQCAEAQELASRHELALREGDHRIKNSLQIVASLMGMQERRETNPTARAALHTATARIHAVSRMHDALQLNGSTNVVQLGALIETMCASLRTMASDASRVAIVVDAAPLESSIEVAQPVVLMVNELVLNALRHAFSETASGVILVTLHRTDGALCVSVADNGAGLPPGYDTKNGFGMKLVRMMASKIGATLQIQNSEGARFTLTVPGA